jgi:hypothetical protein
MRVGLGQYLDRNLLVSYVILENKPSRRSRGRNDAMRIFRSKRQRQIVLADLRG